MEAGRDLADLRPIDPDPNAKVLGGHRGNAYSLNVPNPKPGQHYVYVRREDGEVQRFENEGWTVSRRDTGAQFLRERDPHFGLALDGTYGRRDVIRMEINDEGYAAYMERKQERTAAQSAENVVAEFIAKGEPLTAHLHSNAPLYYKGARHRTDRRVAGVSVNDE